MIIDVVTCADVRRVFDGDLGFTTRTLNPKPSKWIKLRADIKPFAAGDGLNSNGLPKETP